MSLLEHLQELRLRLRNAALVFAAATLGAWYFSLDFFHFLARPVEQALRALQPLAPPTIVKLSPSEGFWVQVKLSLVLGLVVALPLIFWELWKFVAPALYRRERRLALIVTGATVGCFLGGAVFGYTLLARTTHLFLLGSGVEVRAPGGLIVINMLTMENVANFQITLLLGCGAAFELPIVLAVLGWLGLIGSRGMWRFNRHALVLAAVAAALLTPGNDAYAQLLLAIPLYLLYNLSIGLVWLIERRRARAAESPLLLLLAWTGWRLQARIDASRSDPLRLLRVRA